MSKKYAMLYDEMLRMATKSSRALGPACLGGTLPTRDAGGILCTLPSTYWDEICGLPQPSGHRIKGRWWLSQRREGLAYITPSPVCFGKFLFLGEILFCVMDTCWHTSIY